MVTVSLNYLWHLRHNTENMQWPVLNLRVAACSTLFGNRVVCLPFLSCPNT
jgi:hypothetical protein